MLAMDRLNLSISNVITTIIALLILRFVLLAVYRLTWHPLAGFPGPRIAAITGLYEFYYDVVHGKDAGQKYTYLITDMHEKYGK